MDILTFLMARINEWFNFVFTVKFFGISWGAYMVTIFLFTHIIVFIRFVMFPYVSPPDTTTVMVKTYNEKGQVKKNKVNINSLAVASMPKKGRKN